MEFLMSLYDWIMANGGGIAAALLAFHAFALAVVNLTPTPKDDAIVAKLYKVIEIAAGVLTRKAKQ